MSGLYSKYNITKTDGTDIDPDAVYFVLRLDTDAAARIAVRRYAKQIRYDNSELSNELYLLADQLARAHHDTIIASEEKT